jgi:ABC-type amino acid transport substrate-binding protein
MISEVKRLYVILASGMLLLALGGSALAGTLDDIRSRGALRVAYREDAPPFSYRTSNSPTPVGFMVDLCRAVAQGIGTQIGNAELKVVYVPVTSADRFDAITGDKADLLCEATTQTLKRRETLSFSIPTFVDGASFIIRPSGPKDLKSLAGNKVGVLVGTTTENELRDSLKAGAINAEVVTMKAHQEGFDAVKNGTIAAYFADRGILSYMLTNDKSQVNLLLADTFLSVEPYALAMRRGDEDFRLAVDRALSQIYRSGLIKKIFAAAFGASTQPSPTLVGLYVTAALPQ